MPRSTLFAAFAALVLAGCGGGGGGGGSRAATSLSISAPVTTTAPGGTIVFVAHANGGGTVSWSASGGTITSNGVFTAPTTQGTYTVTAKLGALTSAQTVTVTNGIAIALTSTATPPLAIPASKLSFTASVTGALDGKVLWSATNASGTAVSGAVASDGTFTAPATVGTYTVIGTADADATKTAKATVQVVANVNVRVTWKGKGDVVLSLRPDVAPNTTANYVTLVNKGFYDGIVLHRQTTLASDGIAIVQWGDPLTKTLPLTDPSIGSGGPGYTIPFEVTGLSNVRYSLAMARESDPNSAGSQVYVNTADNSAALDHTDTNQGYAVFGAVASGQSVVDVLVVGDVITTAKTEAVAASAAVRRPVAR